MKVVVAEKPSVARDLAAFLGAKERKDGYFLGNGWAVTWALGHLVTLKEPEDYNPELKKWSLANLPFVPEKFELKLIENEGAKKQFKIVKELLKKATEVICATDAGREGELIFRQILKLANAEHLKASRLWLSSLTEEAIKLGFEQLKPLSEYDNLYAAAKSRSEADWVVGLNATRYFTVRYGSGGHLWSLGRVQTPVLALLNERDEEIRHFVPQDFWELLTKYKDLVSFKYKGERFLKEDKAQELLNKTLNHPLRIDKIQAKQEKSFAPPLFDLTELQREMNKRFGLSAQETLDIAQELYETKLITYPRTDSNYLSNDMRSQVTQVMGKLTALFSTEIAPLNLSALSFSSRIINDKKVTDHHAIIPTGLLPKTLSSPAQKIYDAISLRLIAAFYPPCLKEVTTIDATCQDVPFQAKGVVVKDPGWTLVLKKIQDDKEDEKVLPPLQEGENGPHVPFLKKGTTEPPKAYSENTLLGAMETAGKFVDDEELKEALKEKGLGTPATRAQIIETLLRRGYIERNKKNLTVTEKGRYLLSLIDNAQLKSAEMTGEWEAKLKQMEKGSFGAAAFMQEIASFTQGLLATSTPKIDAQNFGPCPRCQKPIIEGKRGWGCSGWKEGCTFVLWKDQNGSQLTDYDAKTLLQTKKLRLKGKNVMLYLTKKGMISSIEIPEAKNAFYHRGPVAVPGRRESSIKQPFQKAAKSSRPQRKTRKASDHGYPQSPPEEGGA